MGGVLVPAVGATPKALTERMQTMSRTLVLLTVLMLVPAIAAQGSQPIAASNAPVELKPQGLFQSLELPYEGHGMVSVLNDGEVVVRFYGEWTPDPCPDPETGEVEVLYVTKEAVYLAVDTATVRLAEADGEWFLDKNGVMIEARGLPPSQVWVTEFGDGVDEEAARRSLVDVSGDLMLAFDRETGVYRLEISGENSGERFTLTFRALGRKRAGIPARAGGASSSCSAACPRGSCNISCTSPKWAKCYCTTGGDPVCECVRKPEEIDPLEPVYP
jgi:hypothetical protein